MSDFHWETDETAEWEAPQAAEPRPLRPRWLLVILLLLLVAALGAWLFYRQARLGLVRVKADVRQAGAFFYTTAATGDEELLRSLLSGRDAAWLEQQLAAVTAGDFLDRPSFGLRAVDAAPTLGDVSLSPDLRAAEMQVRGRFVGPGIGLVTLALPTVFRQGDRGQWLYSPPLPEYWGPPTTLSNAQLRLTFPARDAALGERLFADLSVALRQVCQARLAYDCPRDAQVAVTLSTDPAVLQQPIGHAAAASFTLPTPSLVGLPVDEAGYAALRAGYARQLFTPLIAGWVGYACCEHVLYFNALVERQLADLGLVAWPLTAADYEQLLLRDDVALNLRVDVGWEVSDAAAATAEQRREALALVAFIAAADPALPLAAAQRAIGGRPQRFTTWITALMSLNEPTTGLGQEWQPASVTIPGAALDNGNTFLYRFLHARAALPATAPPRPYPAADVIAACRDGQAGVLLRYRPQNDAWTEVARMPGTALRIVGVPRQPFLWLEQTPDGANAATQGALWSEETGLLPVDRAGLQFFGTAAPDGAHLPLIGWDADGGRMQHYLLDVAACAGGRCAPQPTSGPVRWSPDGRYRLEATPDGVALRDAQGATLYQDQAGDSLRVDFATAEWLDADTVAWIAGDGRFLASRDVGSDQVQGLLTAAAAQQLLPQIIAPPYELASFTVNPHRPQEIFVNVLVDAVVDKYYVVVYDRQAGTARWLRTTGESWLVEAAPAGTLLAGTRYFNETQRPYLLIYDAASDTPHTYPAHSSYSAFPRLQWWSGNGRDAAWGLLFGAGYLRLLRPHDDYVRAVIPPLATCTSAAWLPHSAED